MRTKQTIAIIGAAGRMGSAMAKSLSYGNYQLLLFGEQKAALKEIEKNIRTVNTAADVACITCSYTASWEADIIILAVPFEEQSSVAEKIREVANQKVIISVTNPSGAALNGLVTLPDTSAAEELQRLLPHSKVIKAFNTISPSDFGSPIIGGEQVDTFLAGDDDEALAVVREVVEAAGFHPVITGKLSMSRVLEGVPQLLLHVNNLNHYKGPVGIKILHS